MMYPPEHEAPIRTLFLILYSSTRLSAIAALLLSPATPFISVYLSLQPNFNSSRCSVAKRVWKIPIRTIYRTVYVYSHFSVYFKLILFQFTPYLYLHTAGKGVRMEKLETDTRTLKYERIRSNYDRSEKM